MEIAELILEYLKVILSTPVMLSLVIIVFFILFKEDIKALLLRIAKIKLPGGAEVSTPQTNQSAVKENKSVPEPSIDDQVSADGLPTDLSPQQKESVEQIIRGHIATSYIWEYRFLNYFLVRHTQQVLDWLISLSEPTTFSYYNSMWLPIIPSANERDLIINALQAHHLVQLQDSGLIEVTPKGFEYQEWRGELPQLTSGST